PSRATWTSWSAAASTSSCSRTPPASPPWKSSSGATPRSGAKTSAAADKQCLNLLYMQVPSHVEYERATSVDHAHALLSRPDARVLAGGHSLIPMMKLRLAQPEMLVDINGLAELASIKLDGAQLRIGALARHADLLDSAVAGQHFRIFHDA